MRESLASIDGRGVKGSGVRWALDTETNDGRAVLVTIAGDGAHYLEFPKGFRQIFDWLSRFSARFMAYNMDFDARALLKFLPQSVWLELYRAESAQWRGLTLVYKPSRYFLIRDKAADRSVAIYDTAVHFQKSLAVASKELLGSAGAKKQVPKSWYKDMGARLRDKRTRDKLLDYALTDAEACRDLWRELDRQFRGLGIPDKALDHPVSPGAISAAYFGERFNFDLPIGANWTAKRAYAGARIEVFRRGRFNRVWIYDINSAYPYQLSKCPDPRELDFVRTDGERDDAQYSVYKVLVKIPPSCKIPPITVFHPKESMRIFPCGKFHAWITGPEMKLLARRGWLEDIEFGYHLVGERKPWLTDLPRLYQMRKDRPEIAQALKLVLNSAYGKLAQLDKRNSDTGAIDATTRVMGGRFVRKVEALASTTNFFVAAYVTAGTRLQIWEILNRYPDQVILAATDGVMLTRPLERDRFKIGKGLGQWSLKSACARAVVVGAGVYAVYDGRDVEERIRGYRMDGMTLREALRSDRTRLKIKSKVVYSLGDWAARGVGMNEFCTVPRTLDVNFDRKRIWPRDWAHARDLTRENMGSRAPILLEE